METFKLKPGITLTVTKKRGKAKNLIGGPFEVKNLIKLGWMPSEARTLFHIGKELKSLFPEIAIQKPSLNELDFLIPLPEKPRKTITMKFIFDKINENNPELGNPIQKIIARVRRKR